MYVVRVYAPTNLLHGLLVGLVDRVGPLEHEVATPELVSLALELAERAGSQVVRLELDETEAAVLLLRVVRHRVYDDVRHARDHLRELLVQLLLACTPRAHARATYTYTSTQCTE